MRPELSAPNVVNGADYRGGGVAPGEIVVLFPSRAWASEARGMADDFPEERRGTSCTCGAIRVGGRLAGTRVLFDNVAAPIVYSAGNRAKMEAIVPYEVSGGKRD